MNFEELNTKIIEWAKDREIDKKGTIAGQAIKTIEEMSELIKGICKNDIDLIKDSIGDVYVTLIIGCMLSGTTHRNYIDRNNIEYRSIERILKLLGEEIIKFSESDTPYASDDTGVLVVFLKRIANYYNTTLGECVQLAYDEIANRKGKMIDGQFVKEADL